MQNKTINPKHVLNPRHINHNMHTTQLTSPPQLKATLVDPAVPVDATVLKSLADLVMEGFRLMSMWTGNVLEQIVYKYAHPAPRSEDVTDYVDYEYVS